MKERRRQLRVPFQGGQIQEAVHRYQKKEDDGAVGVDGQADRVGIVGVVAAQAGEGIVNKRAGNEYQVGDVGNEENRGHASGLDDGEVAPLHDVVEIQEHQQAHGEGTDAQSEVLHFAMQSVGGVVHIDDLGHGNGRSRHQYRNPCQQQS